MRILPPTVFNRTEFEWRLGSHNHAVKADYGHDGWETMCGMKILHPWHIKNKRPPTTESQFCKRCLHHRHNPQPHHRRSFRGEITP